MDIKRQPSIITPKNSPIIYEIESSDSGKTFFRYVYEIESYGVTIANKKSFPFIDGTNRYDIQKVIGNYLEPYPYHSISGVTELDDRIMPYDVKIGYVSSEGDEELTSTGEKYIINAVYDNFNYEDFMMDGDGRFLTNSPKTIDIFEDDYYTLDFIIGEYSGMTSEVDEVVVELDVLMDAQINITGTLDQFVNSGETSETQSYKISGSQILDSIVINAPDGYEISLDEMTWTSGITLDAINYSVSETDIYVRFIGQTKYINYYGNITHTTNSEYRGRDIIVNQSVSGYYYTYKAEISIVSTMTTFYEEINITFNYNQYYYVSADGLVDDMVIESKDGFLLSYDQINWTSGITISPTDNSIPYTLLWVKYDGSVDKNSVITHTTFDDSIGDYKVESLIVSSEMVDSFATSWLFDSGDTTITLEPGNLGEYDAYIIWGDNHVTHVTSYDDTENLTHTYNYGITGGDAIIRIIGNFPWPKFKEEDKTKLNTILNWGDIGLMSLDETFKNCINMSVIVADEITNADKIKYYEGPDNVTYGLSYTFENTSIYQIPIYLFKHCTEVEYFNGTFQDCSNLKLYDYDYFKYNTKVKQFDYTFSNCDSISINGIPENLFMYNTLVYQFDNTFSNSSISSIPENLFKYNINVTHFDSVFMNTNITSIPENLFKYNTIVREFTGMFLFCFSLTSIPENLFMYNTSVESFTNTFGFCDISSIPENLFKYNTLVESFNLTFTNTNITSIPENLFKYNTLVESFFSTFSNTNITSIPENLFMYNTDVLSFNNTFSSCTSLTGITEGLFDYNTLVEYFGVTFAGSTSLNGDAPELWLRTPEPVGTMCFRDCTSLTNYGDIPSDWK